MTAHSSWVRLGDLEEVHRRLQQVKARRHPQPHRRTERSPCSGLKAPPCSGTDRPNRFRLEGLDSGRTRGCSACSKARRWLHGSFEQITQLLATVAIQTADTEQPKHQRDRPGLWWRPRHPGLDSAHSVEGGTAVSSSGSSAPTTSAYDRSLTLPAEVRARSVAGASFYTSSPKLRKRRPRAFSSGSTPGRVETGIKHGEKIGERAVNLYLRPAP